MMIQCFHFRKCLHVQGNLIVSIQNTDRPSETESRVETCNVSEEEFFFGNSDGEIYLWFSKQQVRNGGIIKTF